MPSRREGKAVLVDLAAVQQKALERHAIEVASGAGVPAARGGVANGKMAIADGDLAARVFQLLEEGLEATEIVRRERVLPKMILELTREFEALKELRGGGKPSIASRLGQLASRFEERIDDGSQYSWDLDCRLTQMEKQLETITHYLGELPLPTKSQFKCSRCGTQGLARVIMVCGSCWTQDTWGFAN